ncbi:IclR family transcriptional regulator [Roseicyclus sp. F158]|uniref:IclR family transcriptional regulator n=1 Tax=Tropicimonas omnivorans TaxID=3075590 RepID=A0ABU3DHW0_9RHOB|nr:IclR family transcriptional regulator [Roseicyclus sp. F158]MDT0683143.1 IclR family transcriptional regulator [Roseicyclus sp. F158]
MAEGSVQSVARALTLLRLLGRTREGASVSDLARTSRLPVSTTHRLLTTLESEGFALFDGTTRLWHVGHEAFSTGLAFDRRHALAGSALPHLRRLRDRTRETANVGLLQDGRLVTIGQVESREIMRAIAAPGGAGVPASASGMGKAILATWPEDAVRAHVDRHGLPPMTSKSHRDLAGLLRDLTEIRARGWALDDEEHAPGLRCIAAVVSASNGEATGAVSVSGLSLRLTNARLSAVGDAVMQASDLLGRELAGS